MQICVKSENLLNLYQNLAQFGHFAKTAGSFLYTFPPAAGERVSRASVRAS